MGSIPHGGLIELFLVPLSKCSTTGVTKTGMCYPVCGMVHIKEPLLLFGKSSHVSEARFLSHYLTGHLLYVRRHITKQNVLNASLNKTYPSFFTFENIRNLRTPVI